MIYKEIALNSVNSHASKEAKLSIFLHGDDKIRPAMIVVPGGGYHFVAQSEAKPVALRYLSEGFNCFVVDYIIQTPYPAPHLDLASAIKYVKEHKEEFMLDGNVFAVGFSAGGHLVGSYSYLYKELADIMGVDPSILKPSGIILSYPVISVKEHLGTTRRIVTGGDESLLSKFCIDENITSDYPPTFIWTTNKDTLVNPINTEMMADSLKKNHVIYEKHIFANLEHGTNVMSMDTRKNPRLFTDDDLACKRWVDLSINFIVKNFYL